MRNVELSIEGDILTLRVDLSQECGLTKSERSVCVATTDGNLQIWADGSPRNERVNLNVFRPISKEEIRIRRGF